MLTIIKSKLLYCILVCLVISSCAVTTDQSYENQAMVSVFDKIRLPVLSLSRDYSIFAGPLFVMQKMPIVSYRVIPQDEIEFIGSNKKVNHFFDDAYHRPSTMSETSFSESYTGYAKSQETHGLIKYFIYSQGESYKVYLVNKNLTFAIEATLSSEDQLDLLMMETTIIDTE